MYRSKGDSPSHAGSLLPPATTRRFPERPSQTSREARIAPPFIPGQPRTAPPVPTSGPVETELSEPQIPEPELKQAEYAEPEPTGPEPTEPEEVHAESPAEATESFGEPAPVESVPAPAADTDEGALLPWENTVDDQGIVEPAFLTETDAVFAQLTEAVTTERDEFPLDAFIVPEDSHHVPAGMSSSAEIAPNAAEPVASLAQRLEDLSRLLRDEDTDAIVRRLAAGDRLDSMLAGLLAGYLAGKSEHS